MTSTAADVRVAELSGSGAARRRWPRKLRLFKVDVSATTCHELANAIGEAARERRAARVTALAVHGLMTADTDAGFAEILEGFDAIAPDGQPVRLALNLLHRAALPDRVRAVQLTLAVCELAARDRTPVYLLGSRMEVVEALKAALERRLPTLPIVGSEPGVYRELTDIENDALVKRVQSSGAGLLLIGLGCPHQERFAHRHRSDFAAVQMCVGSVFDILSGHQPDAPAWVQRYALEWLFRLLHEPSRLWRRYAETNSRFLIRLPVAMIRSRRP
jgi:exopolysaccharide biosynthesis WecB/TagA/CpsF family protein